ncbi:MAG: cation acetate symporter, partial [Betaproteobacteria bacterium]|nr:cation acetate symporter [Betaproteobacteria bacterium]
TYVVAQIYGVGLITTRLTGVQFEIGIFLGLAGILVCSFLGGMRAVTWTQVAQYIILIVAYLIPVVWLSVKQTSVPIPQAIYGFQLEKVTEKEKALREDPKEKEVIAKDTFDTSRRNFMALIFCLMVGTAALPHILMRYYTTPSVREARASVGWSLFFIFLLYFTAPALAVLVKYEVFHVLVGTPFDKLPAWIANWSKVDAALLSVVDINKDGILQLGEMRIGGDIVVLATPEIAGLPYVISGLVAAGGLAAALSTADGLLLTIANALSHDLYYKMIDPNASTARRVSISKALLLVVALAAAYVAAQKPADILFLVSAAFSFAAAAFFPALVLGVFWKRANKWGASLGMIAGLGVTFYYMVTTQPWLRGIFGVTSPIELWWGIQPISAGVFGVPLGFAVIIIVSLLTAAPGRDVQELVEHVRYPNLKGDTLRTQTD